MRKNEIIKTICLSLLIFMSIIQTTVLWLGEIPGQSFFEEKTVKTKVIEPDNIWMIKPNTSNGGALGAFGYPIDPSVDQTKREFDRLTLQLQKVMRLIDAKQIKEVEDVSWEKLLGTPSVCYEYVQGFSFGEIGGIESGLMNMQNIDTVFWVIDSKNTKGVKLYLVSTEDDVMYEVKVDETAKEINKLYTYFTSPDRLRDIRAYQPSAVSNVKDYIEGNKFLSIADSNAPLEYEVLTLHNPINLITENGTKELERRINGFFVNPLLKDLEYTEDGGVMFTEEMKCMVSYSPRGIVEYINLSPKTGAKSTTRLSAYEQASKFLENTDVITDTMKEKLFLSKINVKNNETVLYYDLKHNGYAVEIDYELKRELGMDAWAVITVRNDQVMEVKVMTLELEPKYLGKKIYEQTLITEYVDPINKWFGELKEDGNNTSKFENSKAMYYIRRLTGSIMMTRGVLINGRWYE
ncbi:MAG: hypothetical protein ACRCSG_06115 [Cellulosilyticaceae bacterium]